MQINPLPFFCIFGIMKISLLILIIMFSVRCLGQTISKTDTSEWIVPPPANYFDFSNNDSLVREVRTCVFYCCIVTKVVAYRQEPLDKFLPSPEIEYVARFMTNNIFPYRTSNKTMIDNTH